MTKTIECVECAECGKLLKKATADYLMLDTLKLHLNYNPPNWMNREKPRAILVVSILPEAENPTELVFCDVPCITGYLTKKVQEARPRSR